MRWYVSYPILAAGLAVGFQTLFPGSPSASRAEALRVQGPAADSAPTIVMGTSLLFAEHSRLSAFSPGQVLTTASLTVDETRTSVLDYLAETLTPLDLKLAVATSPPPTPVTAAAWTSAVLPAQPVAELTPTNAAPAAPPTRITLARDIQAELKRVGCYVGEIDGVWGSGSKRAASMFMDRVNAALPMNDPDVFMLSLLRGQDDEVCGALCPQGQGMTGDGRCVPAALLAQAGRSPQRTAELVTGSIPARRPVLSGRMSIGGPQPQEAAQPDDNATAKSSTYETEAFRTAALEEDTQDGFAEGPVERSSRASSFDADPRPAAKKAKASSKSKSARARPVRYGSYRHVQRLFENPLGRM